MSELGIKDTKEALLAILSLSTLIITVAKDGIQLKDVGTILDELKNNPDYTNSFKEGVAGIGNIKDEIKNLNATEVAELVITAAAYIPKVIDALQK